MRYLVTTNVSHPFFTNWFDSESHFDNDVEMVVYDLIEKLFTTDGKSWNKIAVDHL